MKSFVPGVLLKWGTSWLLLFFILTLLLSSLVSYNDVVKGKVIISGKIAPAQILAKETGKVAVVFYEPGDEIVSGSVLGMLDNTAKFSQVMDLRQKLERELLVMLSYDSLQEKYPANYLLGPMIQPAYYKYISSYQNKIFNLNMEKELLVMDRLSNAVLRQDQAIEGKKIEMQWGRRNLDLLQANLERNQALFRKGVISKQDLERIEKEYNEEQQRFHEVLQELNHLALDYKNLVTEKDLFQNNEVTDKVVLAANLNMAYQELIHAILLWEENFVLRTPISGTVSFFEEWSKHRIEKGELIFTVLPSERKNLVGKCMLPLLNSGKVVRGQRAIIKLENYPSAEWGTVEGWVNKISEARIDREDIRQVVYLEVKDLTTSYGKELQIKESLSGTAEIILDEISVMDRVFFQFRQMWSD